MKIFEVLKDELVEFFFPPNVSCYICDDDLDKKCKTHICDKCKSELPFIQNPCKKCGKGVELGSSCQSCISRKYYFDRAVAVVNFDGNAKFAIYKLKMNSHRYMADLMGYYMYCAFINANLSADTIVCVPMHKNKQRKRGYNQARDLLKSCNKYLNLEDLSKFIVQNELSPAQKDLNARDRFAVAKDKYKLIGATKFRDRTIVIIDDVFTTGATTSAIAQILKYAGAKKVYVLTFASVPYDVEKQSAFDEFFAY